MTAYFVSGASSGIGAELARQLAARGDDLALAARRVDRLEALAAELRPLGVRVTTHQLDVTDPDAVAAVVAAADDAHGGPTGGLDVVVVNAGTGGGAPVGTGRPDRNAHVLDVNLVAAMAQCDAALERFRARDAGHLVLVSSVAALRPLPGSVAYSTSKAGLRHLGRALQADLADTGVDVTILLPGFVDTEMTTRVRSPLKVGAGPAVRQVVAAMDARVSEAFVPGWWRVVARVVLPLVPDRLLRRFS